MVGQRYTFFSSSWQSLHSQVVFLLHILHDPWNLYLVWLPFATFILLTGVRWVRIPALAKPLPTALAHASCWIGDDLGRHTQCEPIQAETNFSLRTVKYREASMSVVAQLRGACLIKRVCVYPSINYRLIDVVYTTDNESHSSHPRLVVVGNPEHSPFFWGRKIWHFVVHGHGHI